MMAQSVAQWEDDSFDEAEAVTRRALPPSGFSWLRSFSRYPNPNVRWMTKSSTFGIFWHVVQLNKYSLAEKQLCNIMKISKVNHLSQTCQK